MTLLFAILVALVGLSPDETNKNILHPRPSGGLARESRESFRCADALDHPMKEIPLINSPLKALVDDEDYDRVIKYEWRLAHPHGYVVRNEYVLGKRVFIYLHREIMNTPAVLETDHRNHNGLDCQKYNLRNATTAQNQQNRKKSRRCSSRFKGVQFHSSHRKWIAYIKQDGVQHHLGTFRDEISAAIAYNNAAKVRFGEFALLNSV